MILYFLGGTFVALSGQSTPLIVAGGGGGGNSYANGRAGQVFVKSDYLWFILSTAEKWLASAIIF
jgi:hypothetical protein